jgi:hypothetical protein
MTKQRSILRGQNRASKTSEQANDGYRSFRPAILSILAKAPETGLAIGEIEQLAKGDNYAPQGGSIEFDATALIGDGLMERTTDGRRFVLSSLGKSLVEIGSSPKA